MAQLVHELESQQLANRLLKNQIASLQQQANKSFPSILMPQTPTTPNPHQMMPLASMSPPASNSIPTTPTPILSASDSTALLQNLITINNQSAQYHGFNNLELISKNFLRLNEIVNAKLSFPFSNNPDEVNDKENSSSPQSKETSIDNEEEINKIDVLDESYEKEAIIEAPQELKTNLSEISTLKLTEQNSEMKKVGLNPNETNSSIKTIKKQKSKLVLGSEDCVLRNGNYYNKSKVVSTNSAFNELTVTNPTESSTNGFSTSNSSRTPKSALLERRRKAVFELLIHDTYPSGTTSFFFFFIKFKYRK